MKLSPSPLRLSLLLVATVPALPVSIAAAAAPNPVRLPNQPGTPLLIPAGPDAEAQARAVEKLRSHLADATADQTVHGAPGASPPVNVDGDFIIGPTYVTAPERTADPAVPKGRTFKFTLKSADSKFYPGIARDPDTLGTPDPNNRFTLLVPASHPMAFSRLVTIYVPAQYVPGTAAPFMVTADGYDGSLSTILDNMIAAHRLPPLVVVGISPGSFPAALHNDAQGSERGLEYDTMSGKYAEFVEAEVLPVAEKTAGVKLTKDPEGRATYGSSSGGSAAMIMAWYHPELYHRVLTYSGTYVNQQWPFNPETPHGAWGLHEKLIPESPAQPLRIWMEVGDTDNYNRNALRDDLHDWVVANQHMAVVLRAKGYHYQLVFALHAGHTDRTVRDQTLPQSLEWLWQGYPIAKDTPAPASAPTSAAPTTPANRS